MSAARSRPNEMQWLAHKSFIREEYLFKDVPVKTLVETLATRGLHITKAQLEYRLRKWRFLKYLDEQLWQYIERTISSRESQKKKSEVIFCGRRIDRLKVLKETRRHRETSIFKQLTIPTQDLFRYGDLNITQTSQFDPPLQILGNLGWFQTGGVTRGVSELVSVLTRIMPELYAEEHFHTAQGLISGPNDRSALELFKILIYKISNGIERVYYTEWQTIGPFLRSCLMAFPLDLKILRNKSIVLQAFFDNLFKQEVFSRASNNLFTSPLDTIQWLLDLGQNPNCCLNGVFGDFGTSVKSAVKSGDLELTQLLLDCHVRVHGSQAEFEVRTLFNTTWSGVTTVASKLRMIQFVLRFYNRPDWPKDDLWGAIYQRDIGLARDILAQDPGATEEQVPVRKDERYVSWNPETYLEFKSTLTAAAIAGDDFLTLMLDILEGSGRLANSITTDLLIASSFERDVEIVRRLLKSWTLSITCNSTGATPLQAAVAGGNLPVCGLYLEIYGGVSPALMALAACRGHEDVLSMLISFENCVNEPLTKHDFVGFMHRWKCPASHRETPFSIIETIIYQGILDGDKAVANCLTILIEAGARFKEGGIAYLAHRGVEEPLRAALAAGSNPDDQNDEGFSALECALKPPTRSGMTIKGSLEAHSSALKSIRFGQTKDSSLIVEILLQAKARLVGGEVVTAIRNHDEASLCLLLRHGGTLKDTDRWGRNCLEAEILAQNNGLIQQIVEEAKDTVDLAPICAALQMEDRELVQRLLPRLHVQADCDFIQGTAIGLAARCGYLDILEELHVRSSQHLISDEALLPFHRNDLHGTLDLTDYYMDGTSGVSLKTHPFIYPCKCGHFTPFLKGSPLALAALGENSSGFQRLLEKGYRADFITLTVLLKWGVATGFVELLRRHQPRLDDLSPVPRMTTPLCVAIQKGNTLLTNCLVEAGMDVNGYDKTLQGSYSPLQIAVRKKDLTLMDYLLAKGASVNSPPGFFDGLTALQAAVKGGNIGLANMLLQHGARVNARGSKIRGSALELAAYSGNIDMLQLLLHHGAITTGLGREQFVMAVYSAMQGAYHTAAQFLKDKRGWTEADESLLQHLSEVKDSIVYLGEGCKMCRTYCCGEIHDTDSPCIHDFSAEEEDYFAANCRRCNEFDDIASNSGDVEDMKATSCGHVTANRSLDLDA
ncbi:hypothetical protein FAVG1_02525 [Fusarium avenaceum]|nr:hypothetical protein FAVG1_02525 [Fusarium avenaceum]